MVSYAEAHANPNGQGDARPTALQIVKDYNMEDKLAGKVAVVTGVSSGIGVETVRAVKAAGAKLFMTARDLEKAKKALSDLWDEKTMELVYMDQSSLESVKKAANEILAKTDKINLLINNAGVMAIADLQLSKDGYEMQFATNHLAHFLFFQRLQPALIKASTPEFQSRVVNVASSGHTISGIAPTGDYNYEKSDYNPWMAYGRSKTANVYMANEIERRFGAQGLHALSLHPGIIGTDLGRHLPEEALQQIVEKEEKVLKSIPQGAATSIFAALSSDLEGRGGLYLSDCSVAKLREEGADHTNGDYVAHTYNEKEEARLWEESLEFVKPFLEA